MTPEPDCTELSCWPKNNDPDETDRANTCTTEGDTFLKSSIVACSLAARSPRGVTIRGAVAENHSAVRYGSDTQNVASSKTHTIAKRRKRMGTLFPPCHIQCPAASKVPAISFSDPAGRAGLPPENGTDRLSDA